MIYQVWTEEAIARLRMLWAEGHSASEIGRRLGVSKNAVVGKVHRLGLPARPSPIRRDGSGGAPRRPAPHRVTGPTLPPLSSISDMAPGPKRSVSIRPIPARAVTPPAPKLTTNPCAWPIGEPRSANFRYCDKPTYLGRVYCPEHSAIAYRPADRARE
jgi:GcrA cell cycle regulator